MENLEKSKWSSSTSAFQSSSTGLLKNIYIPNSNSHLSDADSTAAGSAIDFVNAEKPETSDNEINDDYYEDVLESYDALFDHRNNRNPFMIHSQLLADVERLEDFYNDVIFIQLNSINECEVLFPLSTEFLNEEFAAAWRLCLREPIMVRLNVNLCHYMDGQCPTVNVYQESRASCGALVQLKNILMNFLKASSNVLSNHTIKENFQCKSIMDCNNRSDLVPSKQCPMPCSPVFKDVENSPGLESGFLVQIAKYAELRFRTLNDYCVICDDHHKQLLRAMLKPTVCSKELCTFSYQALGVMSDAAEYTETQPEVVDLLISMAKEACRSVRCGIIFDPYPSIADPEKPGKLALDPKDPDISKVLEILDNFPNSDDLFNFDGVGLKKELDSRDSLMYPLLLWIIANNRSHIIKLEAKKQLKFMNTPHQYLLRTSPPIKEAIFSEARKKFESTFAFHGSSIENWYSILNMGLLNASGTKYQMHGAVCGGGIYLSPLASTSFGYCDKSLIGSIGRKPNGTDLIRGLKRLTINKFRGPPMVADKPKPKTICIALCEVIKSPDLGLVAKDILLMPNPDYVVTRFFFVYKNGSVVTI